MEMLIG